MAFKVETIIINEGNKGTIALINELTGARVQVNIKVTEEEATHFSQLVARVIREELGQ